MYYYIIDPPQAVPAARIAQRLQELITPLGISGEINVATPARTSEELAYMGIDKGYTTFIAVGDEALANTVATILLNESREKIAFGIVPLNAGPLIPQLVGAPNNDMRRAVEIIKQRHLDLVDLIQIGTKSYTFTEAIVAAPRQVKVTLEIDQLYKAECHTDLLHITNDLLITIPQDHEPKGIFHKTLSAIGLNAPKPAINSSLFHGKQIRIMAHEPLPILVAGQVVAKTPTTVTKVPAGLKLITTRAILPTKTISDLPLRSPKNQDDVATQASHKEIHS